MATTTSKSGVSVTVLAGRLLAVSTTGEAAVDIIAGAYGPGVKTQRIVNSKQVFGPYSLDTVLNIRSRNGADVVTYADELAYVTARVEIDPVTKVPTGKISTLEGVVYNTNPFSVTATGKGVRDVITTTMLRSKGSLQYAWFDKVTGAFIADIAGASGASPLAYTLVAADIGYDVRAYVTSYQPVADSVGTVAAAPPVGVTGLIATPKVGGGGVLLTYTAPSDTAPSNGGSAITSITAVDSRSGAVYTLTGSPFDISGLTNGEGRMFTVYVNNAAGASLPVRSNFVTPAPLVVLPTPVLQDAMDNLTGWTAGAPTTQLIDTTGGVSTLQLTGGGSGSSYSTKTLANASLTPAALGVLLILADLVGGLGDITSISAPLIRGGVAGEVSISNAATVFAPGKHWLGWSINDTLMAPVKALAAGTLQLRPKASQQAAFASVIRWSNFYSNADGRTMYSLSFDDAPISQYTTVFPMLEARGLKATFYIPVNFIGQPGKMTWEMLIEMSEAGHCIALNTPDDTLITTGYASDAALTAAMLAAGVTLKARVPRAYLGSMALSNGAFTAARLAALAAANIKTARTTNPETLHVRAGWGNQNMTYPSYGGNPSTPASLWLNGMIKAKLTGSLFSMHIHDVSTTPSSNGVSTAVFTQVMDAVQADVLAGAAVNYTIDVIDALVSTYSTANFGQ